MPTQVASHQRWIWIGTALAAVAILAAWLSWKGYGKTTDEGYRYAVAIYTACNQQDAEKLQTISRMLEAAAAASEIAADEQRWLQTIVADGMAGRWDAANAKVRQLMEAQAEQAGEL
ncbi:MAG: hypothetical protein KDB14_19485 [Planctomycetales bacterium]|nr:hypothetical protein [Planctomycetales bacterium]